MCSAPLRSMSAPLIRALAELALISSCLTRAHAALDTQVQTVHRASTTVSRIHVYTAAVVMASMPTHVRVSMATLDRTVPPRFKSVFLSHASMVSALATQTPTRALVMTATLMFIATQK